MRGKSKSERFRNFDFWLLSLDYPRSRSRVHEGVWWIRLSDFSCKRYAGKEERKM